LRNSGLSHEEAINRIPEGPIRDRFVRSIEKSGWEAYSGLTARWFFFILMLGIIALASLAWLSA
jgi:hypothetical protein